jgi:NAD(P)-dependent dehydrogenase (short-subunit alcohol dehydrogenase family)
VSDSAQTTASTGGASRRLEGRVAIVTGAAKGLGAGIARRLAAEGAAVACADVLDTTELAAGLLPLIGGDAHMAVGLDVSKTDEVDRFVGEVAERYGRLDLLVNNAAVIQPRLALVDTPDEVVERIFAVNVAGTIACARAAGRIMRKQGSGRIINFSSLVAKAPWPELAVYAASKAAVVALTQAMALELADSGVFVNCICPGTMDTDQMRGGFAEIAERRGIELEQAVAEKAASMPLGRLGTPEDAAALVAWLASEEASFSTGATFNLTGGESVAF